MQHFLQLFWFSSAQYGESQNAQSGLYKPFSIAGILSLFGQDRLLAHLYFTLIRRHRQGRKRDFCPDFLFLFCNPKAAESGTKKPARLFGRVG
jgi:hypothetical protein